jgi:hypothetical protein
VNIQFKENTYVRTLTVEDINYDINWNLILLGSGLADLPSGNIKKGDVITDCYGIISLYLGSDNFLGAWDFGNESEYEEEIRFNGVWSPDYDEVDDEEDSYVIVFSIANSYNVQSWYKNYINSSIDIGKYRTENNILILSNITAHSYSQIGYDFSEDSSKLIFYNWPWDFPDFTLGIEYIKTINSTQTLNDIINDNSNKVLITGIITNTTNETTVNIILDESEINVQVSFENYSIENISEYINKHVDIIGFIYTVDSDDLWYKAIIKEIESIFIIEYF